MLRPYKRIFHGLTELARFDTFFACFVKQDVDFGLEVFFFDLQVGHLLIDGLRVVAFVEFAVAGGYGFAFAEVFQGGELFVGIRHLLLEFLQLLADIGDVGRIGRVLHGIFTFHAAPVADHGDRTNAAGDVIICLLYTSRCV